MRRVFIGLVVFATLSATARAGVYIPADPDPYPLPPTKGYRLRLGDMTALAVKESDYRKAADTTFGPLQKKQEQGTLSTNETLSLSGYYIRIGSSNQALTLLTAALAKAPKHALLNANLASAYQALQQPQRAINHLEIALNNWPTEYPGWTKEKLAWYARAEVYHLALLKSRLREQIQKKPENTLDELFPGVTLDNPTQPYLVGDLSAKMKGALPPDALKIIEQLLLWLPQDNRLLWYFGELLNAAGEVAIAKDVFSNLRGDRRFNAPALTAHWNILRTAQNPPEAPLQMANPDLDPQLSANPTPVQQPQEAKKTLPAVKELVVGFFAGLIVGILVLLQLRALGRKFALKKLEGLRKDEPGLIGVPTDERFKVGTKKESLQTSPKSGVQTESSSPSSMTGGHTG